MIIGVEAACIFNLFYVPFYQKKSTFVSSEK